MREGGTLSLGTSRQGAHIVVTFKDSGHGIPRDVLQRIFEPFYTTKKDKGTGLGLSISYRIVREHGGRIDVESAEGQGTTFTVRIPVRSAP
jgi:signal transduction histidine kinase